MPDPVRPALIPGAEGHRQFFPFLSRARFYEACRQGLIPNVKLGRQVLLSPDALDEWAKQGGTALRGGWKHATGGK